MKKGNVIILMACLMLVSANEMFAKTAPDKESSWEFYSTAQSADDSKALKDLFNEAYLTKEEIAPGDPQMESVIKNPLIYKAVNSIERYVKVEIKKTNDESLNAQLEHVYCVAIAVLGDDSAKSFEAAIKENRKDPKQLLALFQQVKLKSIY